ncbi:unnamed protein product, partial [Mesorhabditis belari]|uniref:Uncharacterized protein n=1 Tax=Mesorhabditis belari TaxID=2138241 RepID=A0AAF3FMH3_9BILA
MEILKQNLKEKLAMQPKNVDVQESSSDRRVDRPRLDHDYFPEYLIERQKNEIMREQIDVLLKQNGILVRNGLKFVHSATEYKQLCDQSDTISLQAAFGEQNSFLDEINPEMEWESQVKYMEVAGKLEKGQEMDREIMAFMQEAQELERTNQEIKRTVKSISTTLFDIVAGLFGPVLVHQWLSAYFVGFIRISGFQIHIFAVFYIGLMINQGYAIVTAFFFKIKSLSAEHLRKRITDFQKIVVYSMYGSIPILLLLFLISYPTNMIDETAKAKTPVLFQIATTPELSPLSNDPTFVVYIIQGNPILLTFVILLVACGGICVFTMTFLMYIAAHQLTLNSLALSPKTMLLQKRMLYILMIQLCALICSFILPYASFVLVSIIERLGFPVDFYDYVSPFICLIGVTHSGVTSLVVLLCTKPYRLALWNMFRCHKLMEGLCGSTTTKSTLPGNPSFIAPNAHTNEMFMKRRANIQAMASLSHRSVSNK